MSTSSTSSAPMSSFWLVVWGGVLAFTWLIPNHYQPWPSFHSDAWCAFIMLIGSGAVGYRVRNNYTLSFFAAVVAILFFVPLLQHALGLVYFFGQAVVVSAYLLGFFLAIVTGHHWERAKPDQAMNGVFIGIGLAGVLSVALQLQTWLGLIEYGIFNIWSMGFAGNRPYANLGQPNQLATLLLLGVLASAWAFNRKVAGALTCILMASFLLVGVALTQSRTAWLGLAYLTFCSWLWRSFWRSKGMPWIALGLLFFFFALHFSLDFLAPMFAVGAGAESPRGSIANDLRLPAWRLLIGAAVERPWIGYGWTEIGKAQFEVAEYFPPLFPIFGQAHNLFLDFVLWLGVPAGGIISLGLLVWYQICFKKVTDFSGAILLMFLGVVGIHAMLEFPLHYGYFLLPAGVVVGVLHGRLEVGYQWSLPRWIFWLVWGGAAVLLVGIGRDYLEVEQRFREARFEAARIGKLPAGLPPDVRFLTHLREDIIFMRYEVAENMPAHDLEEMVAIVSSYPSGGRAYKVAKALILNHRTEEGKAWLNKICRISSPKECFLIKTVWKRESEKSGLLAAVKWPDKD